MNVEYGVNMPESRKGFKRSKEYYLIKDFLDSDNETMRFTYESSEIATRRRGSLDVTIKREKIPVRLVKSQNYIYVGKIKGKEGK